jgi:hypothetical protein
MSNKKRKKNTLITITRGGNIYKKGEFRTLIYKIQGNEFYTRWQKKKIIKEIRKELRRKRRAQRSAGINKRKRRREWRKIAEEQRKCAAENVGRR